MPKVSVPVAKSPLPMPLPCMECFQERKVYANFFGPQHPGWDLWFSVCLYVRLFREEL